MLSEESIQENIAGHESRNPELLATMRDMGIDLQQSRSVEHHFLAESQHNASLLARALHEKGYLILMLSPVDSEDASNSNPWNVEAGIQRTPEEAASSLISEELVRLAAQFDAVYDGWGTPV